MTDHLEPSPMLEAIDLMRISLSALSDEELDEHAAHVVAVLMKLDNVLGRAVWVSSIAAANIVRLVKKLHAHLALVKELIEVRQVEAAEDESEPPAAPPERKRGATAGTRRGR
jgi:hypothetical protein